MKSVVRYFAVVTISLTCAVYISSPAFSAPAGQSAGLIDDRTTFIDANSILMFVSNTGMYARDLSGVFGYDYGTFYPFTTTDEIIAGTNISSPLYAAGIWLGGMINSELHVTVAEFGTEFWPGSMSAGTFIADADTDPAYRVYKLYADSMETNPNQDYLDWPSSQGAPLDNQGRPLLLGDQTLWCVFNDANPVSHTRAAGSTGPLGIEIQQLVWASGGQDMERIIYIQYKLYNKGANNISDFHIGIWLDPDIGSNHDDLTGCDTLSDLFFGYNADNDDIVYGAAPPAIGARLLYGPVIPSANDTARFADRLMPNFKNLEMSSFLSYVNGTDPANAQESYNLLRGLLQNGDPLTNGTLFSWPGDPIAGTGDLETNPGNRHIVGSFGPISFNPGDSQYVLIKLAVGQGSTNLTSLDNLKDLLNSEDLLPTAVNHAENPETPGIFHLRQNYPNPFNASTSISYTIPEKSFVELAVYNILGEKIKILVYDTRPAGTYTTVWDGKDNSYKEVSTGIYFYRLQAGTYSSTNRMLLLK